MKVRALIGLLMVVVVVERVKKKNQNQMSLLKSMSHASLRSLLLAFFL